MRGNLKCSTCTLQKKKKQLWRERYDEFQEICTEHKVKLLNPESQSEWLKMKSNSKPILLCLTCNVTIRNTKLCNFVLGHKGCLCSKFHERNAYHYLVKLWPNETRHSEWVTIPGLKRAVQFDFVLVDSKSQWKAVIELDGPHHFGNYDYGTCHIKSEYEMTRNYKKQKHIDQCKNTYIASLKGVSFLRLAYTEYNNMQSVLETFIVDMYTDESICRYYPDDMYTNQ
jgi:hypothetical protein